jgi:hypothetical protein
MIYRKEHEGIWRQRSELWLKFGTMIRRFQLKVLDKGIILLSLKVTLEAPATPKLKFRRFDFPFYYL